MKLNATATLIFGCLAIAGLIASTRSAAPSEPPHDPSIEPALKALPENHAVVLGIPRVVGEFNATARTFQLHRTGPTGRDYSIKMVWAPERSRALFAGANHGSPHRLNDVWEFDLPTLTWHMLYAPDNARSYGGLGDDPSDVEFKDGMLVTKRGGPAIIGHTWWGITYDPVRRRVLFMNTWVAQQDKLVAKMGGDATQVYKGPPLWTFIPEKREWAFQKSPRPWPRAPFASALEYAPSLGGAIWQSNHWQQRSTWLFNADKNQWIDLKPNQQSQDFAKQAPAPEQVAYVDLGRNILVAHSKRSTHHFDLSRAHWTKVLEAKDESDSVPFGHDARTGFYFDPLSGHGLLIELATGKIWAYDPATVSWHKLEPQGASLPAGHRRLAYFDSARNVLVVMQTNAVWVYRYRSRS